MKTTTTATTKTYIVVYMRDLLGEQLAPVTGAGNHSCLVPSAFITHTAQQT